MFSSLGLHEEVWSHLCFSWFCFSGVRGQECGSFLSLTIPMCDKNRARNKRSCCGGYLSTWIAQANSPSLPYWFSNSSQSCLRLSVLKFTSTSHHTQLANLASIIRAPRNKRKRACVTEARSELTLKEGLAEKAAGVHTTPSSVRAAQKNDDPRVSLKRNWLFRQDGWRFTGGKFRDQKATSAISRNCGGRRALWLFPNLTSSIRRLQVRRNAACPSLNLCLPRKPFGKAGSKRTWESSHGYGTSKI